MVAWWLAGVALAGTCAEEEAVSTAEALESSAPELRDELAAIGISQACIGPVAEAAAGFSQGSDELRQAADEALAASATCSGEDRTALWEACGLAEHGWFTAAEWAAADGAVWIPIVAGQALQDSGVPGETTRALVRAVAGIGAAATRTKPTFAPDGRVEPRWSRKARKVGGTCTARIAVRPNGNLRKVVFVACPEVLQRDVRPAIEASTFTAASEDGQPAPGRFQATFTVGGR